MTADGVALAFLGHLGNRDVEAARALLAPDVRMIFPGGVEFTRLEELFEWSAPRYRRVAKRIDRADVSGNTVYVTGTLEGDWPDGTPFAGIRFVDRFEVVEGRIVLQEVWNDMAETRRA
ncbi:nuclear transport factor 2 family protein [Chachezhania sediminis]|uniref:nuclear transport factor 2 family protein n=1 Tax=Chachezhania sediminis TaxID=2599291 RepID=UPI00131B356D|nr:nuclear transport factor 2 family protein [Chachezhania sediminis]